MNAAVEITGLRKTPGDELEEEAIHFRQPGKMKSVSGRIHIVCDEADPEEGSISRYHIIVTGDEVAVRKKGPSETDLIFRPGETTEGVIRTPYGQITLNIRTDEMSVTVGEDEVRVGISYELSQGGVVVSENWLRVDVTEGR